MKITMLVATHKAAAMPEDPVYLPVQVGAALSSRALGYQTDAEGENISALNSSYCELTAFFWAWKHTDADAVGLSHYRRYFVGNSEAPSGHRGILSGSEAKELLATYDVVIPKPRHYVVETIESHFRHGHHGSDLDRLRQVLDGFAPAYRPAFEQVMRARRLSLYNMCLMRREAFLTYCEWLFPILEEFSRGHDISERPPYQQRVAGYLGERLLNVWATHHAGDFTIGRRRVINTEGEPKVRKAIEMLRRKLTAVN